MRQPTHSQLRWLNGYSTIEVIAVVVIIGVLLSAVIPGVTNRVNQALYQKTITEMTSIAQACIDYYNSQYPNAWPSTTSPWVPTSVLVTNPNGNPYMYHLVSANPWGNKYEVTFGNNMVEVSTSLPFGIAKSYSQGPLLNITPGSTNDQISIAMTATNETIGQLQYEQKYSIP